MSVEKVPFTVGGVTVAVTEPAEGPRICVEAGSELRYLTIEQAEQISEAIGLAVRGLRERGVR